MLVKGFDAVIVISGKIVTIHCELRTPIEMAAIGGLPIISFQVEGNDPPGYFEIKMDKEK